ncbi:hypothetical protein BS78_04G178000 [Paspalum vaginatum]|nr:hypothetical protein BS78_04G178000 [Paspalum vaginatum]
MRARHGVVYSQAGIYIGRHGHLSALQKTSLTRSERNPFDCTARVLLSHSLTHTTHSTTTTAADQQYSMRTEMVIRMQGGSEKEHAKAMKVAAAVEGVESVTLSGKDKSLLRVVGDGVDCNHLTTRLRRKVGRADLVELRTLHGVGGGGYGYFRTSGGGLLSRDGEYGSGGYGAGYPSYAPDYYAQQPAFQYYHHPPPNAMHQEYYYTTATDPNGCSIM